jgi:hypothetical protein
MLGIESFLESLPCQSTSGKQGAVNHSLLFGLAMRLGQLGEAQAINGVTGAGAGALGELRAKLSLPFNPGTTCKSEVCLSMEIVYKVYSSSLFLIPILIQSCYHRIKPYQQYHRSKRITSHTRSASPLQKLPNSHTKCLAAPPTPPMIQGHPRPPSARAVPLATSTTEFPSTSPQVSPATRRHLHIRRLTHSPQAAMAATTESTL